MKRINTINLILDQAMWFSFTAPVALPACLLPARTYMFKLADPNGDRSTSCECSNHHGATSIWCRRTPAGQTSCARRHSRSRCTTRTEHGAVFNTASATLPSNNRESLLRRRMPITASSVGTSRAASTMAATARPRSMRQTPLTPNLARLVRNRCRASFSCLDLPPHGHPVYSPR
jgi:hypothetical protein